MVERDEAAVAQLKIRVKESVRADLEAAARANNQTLNREIADRLERSLSQERIQGGRSAAFLQIAVGTAIRIAEDASGKDWRRDLPTYRAARKLVIDALDNYQPVDPAVIDAKLRELDAKKAELDAMHAFSEALRAHLMPNPPAGDGGTPTELSSEALHALQPLLDAVQASKERRQAAEASVAATRECVQRDIDELAANVAAISDQFDEEFAGLWRSNSPD